MCQSLVVRGGNVLWNMCNMVEEVQPQQGKAMHVHRSTNEAVDLRPPG